MFTIGKLFGGPTRSLGSSGARCEGDRLLLPLMATLSADAQRLCPSPPSAPTPPGASPGTRRRPLSRLEGSGRDRARGWHASRLLASRTGEASVTEPGPLAKYFVSDGFKPTEWTGRGKPFFSDLPLDRAGNIRGDNDKLERLWESDDAKLVAVLDSSKAPAVNTDDDEINPIILQPAAAAAVELGVSFHSAAFLGCEDNGAAVFAVGVSAAAGELVVQSGSSWIDVRQSGGLLREPTAAVLAYAVGLVSWHSANGFCSHCGSKTAPSSGGHVRKCTSGAKGCRSVYPRIDPAAIMLITCGDFVLLGRSKRWKLGRYSCLAGFLEVGETLEMNVAREVAEETGVTVDLDRIEYHSSQPWPFPRSLMVGFRGIAPPTGDALPGYGELSPEGRRAAIGAGLLPEEAEVALSPKLQEPTPDREELEDACWFHKDWIRAALETPEGKFEVEDGVPFGLPGRYSLARHMIDGWLEEDRREGWAGDAMQDVNIDSGVFKYVLARVSGGGRSKLVVWGDADAGYHNQVFQQIRSTARMAGLEAKVLGVGRIEHHPSAGICSVYGYSVAFGPAPHEVTAALIRKAYPTYRADSVTISYEGY